MKKVAVLSIIISVLAVPQMLLAGGGPAIGIDPAVSPEAIVVDAQAQVTKESEVSSVAPTEKAVEDVRHTQSHVRFRFMSEMSENQRISTGLNVLGVIGVAVVVLSIAFISYKYYRKTQEINTMLGIGTDLDETKKTE